MSGETGWVKCNNHVGHKFRRRSGSLVPVIEECYLRDDISCGSGVCTICAHRTLTLPADADHYVVPDVGHLMKFSEVFDLSEAQNAVLLASVVKQVYAQGGMTRAAGRVRALLADPRHRCHFFDDLHCRSAASAALQATAGSRVEAVARWYHEHLQGRIPVVALCDAPGSRAGSSQADWPLAGGVHVMCAEEYFPQACQATPTALALYTSLAAELPDTGGPSPGDT
ncbi:hypothetical protein CYMTET_3593, partial [Cymbomonas tetramitiformis]